MLDWEIRSWFQQPDLPVWHHECAQWGKTKTKNPDGTASQIGPFPCLMAMYISNFSQYGLKKLKQNINVLFISVD